MEFSSVNTIWVLLGAALVFFMQAGFAMCEAGFTRAKNTGNILMKNLMDFCIGTPCFWLVGFGLMFGYSNAIFGKLDPLIMGEYASVLPAGVPKWAYVIFQTRVLCNICYNRFRFYGRAYEIFCILHLFGMYFPVYLSYFRPLDLGRRLVEPAGLP